MTSPIEEINVCCPACGHVYQDWTRASVNLSLDNFDDEYLDECSSSVCPQCGHKVYHSQLVVDQDGTWRFSGMFGNDALYSINRTAVVIKPKQPFVDWVNALPDAGELTFTVEKLREDCQVYLIPEFESNEDARDYLKDIYTDIFVEHCYSISTDEDTYPESMSWEMFNEWFEIEFHSMVVDTLPDPIDREEI